MTKGYKEHIYSLEEKPESDISPLWQILQIIFMSSCVVFGFSICFTFGKVLSTMQNNCILFSNLTFKDSFTLANHSQPFDIKVVHSEFYSGYCDAVIFMPIIFSTFAAFFLVMFVYCGRGGAGNQNMPETWRIIMPTIIFNFLSFCFTIVSSVFFQYGLKAFLKSIAKAWKKDRVNLYEIRKLHLEGKPVGEKLVAYLTLTKHFTWLLLSFWGLNFVWILLRCLFNVDFQLVRTTIHVFPKNTGSLVVRKKMRDESSVESVLEDSADNKARKVKFSPSTMGASNVESTLTIFRNESPTSIISESDSLLHSKSPAKPKSEEDVEDVEREIAMITYDSDSEDKLNSEQEHKKLD